MLYDFIGAVLSLLSTYYFIHINIKAWPVGLLATCFNGWLYWHKGIYADMCLESVYFLSICYGWYRWSRESSKPYVYNSVFKRLSFSQWIYISLLFITLYSVIYYLLIHFTHSTVAKLDAITTSLSLIAQCFMCYKVIATWVFWFFADAIYAWLYLSKDLSIHTLLMFLYMGMAIIGFFKWYKKTPLQYAINK